MELPRRTLLAGTLAAFGANADPAAAATSGRQAGGADGGRLINFAPEGVRAVLRSAADKFADVRTFEDFGAVGDATADGKGTDDTVAIQAALDWALANAGMIQMTARNFLCGNIITHPFTTIVGTGRHTSNFIARAGTTGKWWTDNGNAAKTTMSGFGMDARSLPGITAILDLGNNTTQFGTEGILSNLFLRDAINGDGLNVNGNVGVFRDLTVWNCRRNVRIIGNANQILGMVAMQAGEASSGAIRGGPADVIGADLGGCMVEQLEIEATPSGGLPLRINGDCRVSKYVISSANGTTFSHLVEVNTATYNEWSLTDPVMFGAVTVTRGIIKVGNAYQGGTSSSAFSGKSITSALNVQTGALALMDQTYQEIGLRLTSDKGVLKHRMGAKGDSGTAGAYCTKVVGSSAALTATPTRGAAFANGASLQANGGTLVFNTLRPQDKARQTVGAQITRHNLGEALTVSTDVEEYPVNGAAAAHRLAINIWKTDGTRLNLSRLTDGQSIDLTLSGYIA